MNKRIQELVNLSTERGELNIRGDDTIDTEMVFNKEKFAELLIKECLEMGKELQTQTTTNGSDDYNLGREMGIEVFMNQMKKTFWS